MPSVGLVGPPYHVLLLVPVSSVPAAAAVSLSPIARFHTACLPQTNVHSVKVASVPLLAQPSCLHHSTCDSCATIIQSLCKLLLHMRPHLSHAIQSIGFCLLMWVNCYGLTLIAFGVALSRGTKMDFASSVLRLRELWLAGWRKRRRGSKLLSKGKLL